MLSYRSITISFSIAFTAEKHDFFITKGEAKVEDIKNAIHVFLALSIHLNMFDSDHNIKLTGIRT